MHVFARADGVWRAEHQRFGLVTAPMIVGLCEQVGMDDSRQGGRRVATQDQLELVLEPRALYADERPRRGMLVDLICTTPTSELLVSHDARDLTPVVLHHIEYQDGHASLSHLPLPHEAVIQLVPALGLAARKQALLDAMRLCGRSMTGREFATATASWPPEAWRESRGLVSGWHER